MQNSTQLDTATTTVPAQRLPESLCTHRPTCPTAESPDREAAHTIAAHPEQGWSLLCNALVLFEDTGELLPDGRIVPPHRPTGAVDTALPLRLTNAHALIGGTARSGKTNAAALLQGADLASSSSTARSV